MRPEDTPHVTPDASLVKQGAKFKIIINDRYLPKFSINSMYSEICKSKQDDGSLTKEYINEKIPVLYKNKSDLDTIIELYQDESR